MPSSTYAPIGTMDQEVVIQYASTTDDGMGGTTVSWKPQYQKRVYAYVLQLTLSERERLQNLGGQITAIQSYRVVMRYRNDITPKERLKWREKTLQIHTVTDDLSAKRRTVLECTEVQST